jgi:hypothetical protein
MILGFTWLHEHNPKINWQTKEVCMSHCPARCDMCRLDTKHERKEQCAATAQIRACRSSGFPVLIEEVEDKGDCICGGTEESEGGVPRPLLKKSDRFPKDLLDLVDIHDDDDITTMRLRKATASSWPLSTLRTSTTLCVRQALSCNDWPKCS